MTLPAIIGGMSLGEVDGDGRDDIIIFTAEYVWYFLQGDDGSFPEAPNGHLAMPPSTTLFTFADMDGNGPRELFTLTREGFRVIALLDGSTVDVPLPDAGRCLFHDLGNFAASYYWALFRNVVGELPHELVLPTDEGFSIQEVSGPRRARPFLFPYEIQGELELDPPSLEARARKVLRVPPVEFLSLDETAGDEILVSQGRTLATHTVRIDPDDPREPVQTLVLDRLILGFDLAGKDVLQEWQARDLDGDGHADLHRFDAERSEIAFVFGTAGERRVTAPDLVLKLAGEATSVLFQDLDGDRLPELLVFEQRDLSEIGTAMSVLLRGSMNARLAVFANHGSPRLYQPHPSYVTTYAVRPAVGSRWGSFDLGLRKILHTGADVDGDGVKDLVSQPADGKLRVYRGDRNVIYSKDVWREITIPLDAAYKDVTCSPWDFDRDGRDDLLLHYRGWDGSPAESLVLILGSEITRGS